MQAIKSEKQMLEDVLKSQDDFDIAKRVREPFGFFTFNNEESAVNTEEGTSVEIEHAIITNTNNKYEKLQLIQCHVNLYALKKFIRSNLRSLREIDIDRCDYYLRDNDAKTKKNPVRNLLMLEQLDFIWLIESFKFQDLDSLKIVLSPDPKNRAQMRAATMVAHQASAKVSNVPNAQQKEQQSTIKAKKVKEKKPKKQKEEEMKKLFYNDDEEEKFKKSDFHQYEFQWRKQFSSKNNEERMKQFSQDLIWGDTLDTTKFYQKLYENILEDIAENLRIYKKYTKNAFSDGKLFIYGDVLNNGLSRNQLYNVIHINCQRINGIIFKDNGRIPSPVFSDLMTQLFLTDTLDCISFISSVLDGESIKQLRYLFREKDVKYIIFYKSYFLKSEIQLLLGNETENTSLPGINHFRFTILDILLQKQYEFTPYSFSSEVLYAMPPESLKEVEKVYLYQSFYPKQIQDQIVFYQGKNASIRYDFVTDKQLLKYWEILKPSDDAESLPPSILKLKENQEKLIKKIEDFIDNDDVNVLNYNFIDKLISNVLEEDQKKRLKKQLKRLKSYQCLVEVLPVSVLKTQEMSELKHILIAYAYLKGFTRIQHFSPYYLLKSVELHDNVFSNEIKSEEDLQEGLNKLIVLNCIQDDSLDALKLTLTTSKTKSEPAIRQMEKIFQNAINEKWKGAHTLQNKLIGQNYSPLLLNEKDKNTFERLFEFALKFNLQEALDLTKLQKINIVTYNISEKETKRLNVMIKNAPKLKVLQICDCHLTDDKIKYLDFSTNFAELEEFDLSFNNTIVDFKFLETFFQKTKKLKKINFSVMDLTKSKTDTANFSLVPPTLEELKVEYNILQDVSFLNDIFSSAKGLKVLSLYACQLPESLFIELKLPKRLDKLTLCYNGSISLMTVLTQIGLTEDMELKELTGIMLNTPEYLPEEYKQYLTPGSLPGLKKLEKVFLQKSQFADVDYVNIILNNSEGVKELRLTDQKFVNSGLSTMKLQNHYTHLESLDLTYGSNIDSYSFLNDIFQNCKNFKKINLSESLIYSYKFSGVKLELLPESLEEFYFMGNENDRIQDIINALFQRCAKLKILHLERNKITQTQIDEIEAKKCICSQLEDLNLSTNNFIKNYHFLNKLFKRTKLKKLNLINCELVDDYFKDVKFMKAKYLENFKFDTNPELTDEFKKKYFSQKEYYIDIATFESTYSKTKKSEFVNYFRVFEKYNLQYMKLLDDSAYKRYHEQYKEEEKDNNDDSMDQSHNNLKELKDQSQILNNQNTLDQTLVDKKKKEKKNEDGDAGVDEKEKKKFIHPYYFYTLFNRFNQIFVDEDDDAMTIQSDVKSVTSFTNYYQTMMNLSMIDSQNVYKHSDYYLTHIVNNQLKNRIIQDFEKIFGNQQINTKTVRNIITEINLKNKRIYKEFDFLQDFFNNCQNIQKIIMSDLNIKNKKINLAIQNLPNLIEFDFSKSKQNKDAIADFVSSIIKNAPKLQILNLKDTNIEDITQYDFSKISPELLDFDLSMNKDIKDLSCLSTIFSRCQKIKKLNLSNLKIKASKLDQSKLSNIPKNLEELDLSDNPKNTTEIINMFIRACQQLKKLDISNNGIDYQANFRIVYSNMSPELLELDFSSNSYYYHFDFIPALLKRCPKLEKYDFSNQVFDLTYDSICNVGFSSHSLKEFNFSGNQSYNNYRFVVDMILASTQFKKLTIENMNLHTNRVDSFFFDEIGSRIQELDISNHTYLTDLTFLNHLIDSPSFTKFIMNNTCINNSLISGIRLTELFKNLKHLELSQSESLTDYKFFNEIFETAKQLEVLNISKMNMKQSKFDEIDFTKIPSTLQEFTFDGNDKVSLLFLNDLFFATKQSLKSLSLQDCDLTKTRLEGVRFQTLSEKIEKLDFSENKNLDSLEFLAKLFEEKPGIRLKTFKITKMTFEMQSELQHYSENIDEIENEHQKFNLAYFTDPKKYQLSINFRMLMAYLSREAKAIELDQKNASQIGDGQKKEKKPKKSKTDVFNNILKYMVQFSIDNSSIQTLIHFLYLISRERQLECFQHQPLIQIFSPHSIFSQSQLQVCNYESTEDVIPDSYNLAFFTLDLLKKDSEYIFGYDKFQFRDFPEFYQQWLNESLDGENIEDIKFMRRLKSKMIEKNIKRAFLPIKLNLQYKTLKGLGMNEFDVLYLINSIPPATITIKGTSIQFVKSWYAILYSSPLSIQTHIDVDYQLLENTSIANFLILFFSNLYINNYDGRSFKEKIKKLIGNIGYSFFNIFGTPPIQYKFDHAVIHLNNYLQSYIDDGKHNILRFLYPIYLFICVFAVWFFSLKDSVCGGSLSMYSYIMYAIFGAITFLLEYQIFEVVLKFVSHLVPEIKPNCRVTFPNPLINKIKTRIMDIEWLNQKMLNHIMLFVSSQLSRFDFLANLGFILQTYQCSQHDLYIVAICALGVTAFVNFIFFIQNFFGSGSYSQLITGAIDRLYQLCYILEFQAAAELLDFISPSNSVILRRRMFNQRVFTSSLRIIFQDIPLIVVKILFIYRNSVMNSSLIFSIISSIISVFTSFNKFLTITPSRLGQEDFNSLSAEKAVFLKKYNKKLLKYDEKISQFNQYEILKCIKSISYYKKKQAEKEELENEQKSDNQQQYESHTQQKMIKELRNFSSNVDYIADFFGSKTYVDHVYEPEPKKLGQMNFNFDKNQNNLDDLVSAFTNKQQLDQGQTVRIKSASTVKSNRKNQSNAQLVSKAEQNTAQHDLSNVQILQELSDHKADIAMVQVSNELEENLLDKKDVIVQDQKKPNASSTQKNQFNNMNVKKEDNTKNKNNNKQNNKN